MLCQPIRPRTTAAAVLAMLIVLSACASQLGPGPRPSDPPSEAEALAFLDHIIELSRAGEFTALCAIGSGNCEANLETAGRTVPRRDPVLVGQREQPAELYGDYWSASLRILELCGLRDDGSIYYTEIGVFSDGSQLMGGDPIFWSGMGVGDPSHVTGPPRDAATVCAAHGFAR